MVEGTDPTVVHIAQLLKEMEVHFRFLRPLVEELQQIRLLLEKQQDDSIRRGGYR